MTPASRQTAFPSHNVTLLHKERPGDIQVNVTRRQGIGTKLWPSSAVISFGFVDAEAILKIRTAHFRVQSPIIR
jgi:hypothetical protein